MTKKKGLLIEIGVGIAVFMVATVALGILYNRDTETGTELQWTDTNIHTFTDNSALQNSVLAFFNKEDLQAAFPDISGENIDWQANIILAYVSSVAPAADYDYEIIEGQKLGSVATLKYKFSFLETNDAFPLGLETTQSHPVLFVAVDRKDVDTTNPFTFRFQNADTNETHSLTIFENEGSANN
ncbi:hypothetical protein DRH29_02045 [candidate division Kazan bacterium]|uniref:Uncharacterized protein n=1 Tax=candidate division Kazan bacterium TaxID=2202143 RepID=A0A420ZCW4_UNCK3|nr:MAG: hypothetical protein DRH29_02045 [candidate division Kazan bacterium]